MSVDIAQPIAGEAAALQARLLAAVEAAAAAGASDPTAETRFALLASASTLTSQLRGIARRANDDVRRGKRKVADARLDVDTESLALQNLKYQRRQLEEEIRTCRVFRSIFQTIPLTDLDDFKAHAPAEDTADEVLADPHKLQLARLRFELTERRRLEAEKSAVQAQRTSLTKDNNIKKARLEGLEADLKEMLSRSVQVRRRFEDAQQADAAAAAEAEAEAEAAAAADRENANEEGGAVAEGERRTDATPAETGAGSSTTTGTPTAITPHEQP